MLDTLHPLWVHPQPQEEVALAAISQMRHVPAVGPGAPFSCLFSSLYWGDIVPISQIGIGKVKYREEVDVFQLSLSP